MAHVCILLLLFCCCGTTANCEEPAPPAAPDQGMSLAIDELLAAHWARHEVQPTAAADDAELMRRLYLDLTGAIPSVAEARDYLADQRPEKRRELVERLLASPTHATHLADVWRDLMLPRKLDPQQAAGLFGLQNWLRRQFAENHRYDRVVADLLVATGGDASGPALFYTAVGLKPEELGTTTARIFLGMRLDCAQCHNHPFDHWTQQDFWGYAAFFAQLQSRAGNAANMRLVDTAEGEVRLPASNTIVPPRYPAGSAADGQSLGTRRQQLAIWVVSRENPFLARATVNLVWAQLFGRGLVEPVDDIGEHNPPCHPELLAALSDYFLSTGYDLRQLYRTLVNTRAYQLSSRAANEKPAAPEMFAHMAVKTLSPEQFYDSLGRVALRRAAERPDPLSDPQRLAFLVKMQTQTQAATDFELSVPQALTLLNGDEVGNVTDPAKRGLLAALEAPFLNDRQRIDTAFLATLSRYPREDEAARFLAHLQARPAEKRRDSLGDVVWALLNSAEFTLNH